VATPVTVPVDAATQRELADLRKKVDSMGQLVGYSLLQRQPANERLKGILATQDLAAPGDRVLTQLISALALDPSTNVRLSALEALYPYADQEVVRAGVLASLTREQSPLVQVSMIDFLVAARDREAAPTLQQLVRADKVDRSVRDAAKRALVQL
jgi:HEAT repeat protein